MKVASALAVIAMGICFAAGALAQGFPSKPVRIVVPFLMGGAADNVARAVGQKLSEIWGQPVGVANCSGAGGAIGTGKAAKLPADGYTLLVHSSVFATSPALYMNLPYDPVQDFLGIAPLVNFPLVLVAAPSAGTKSVAELIAAAKANPGQLKFGSSGSGGLAHLYGEKFKLASGIDVAHVPGKGATAEIIAGRVTYLFLSFPPLNLIREGKLIALGVASSQRSGDLPEVPTMAEAGVPGFEFTSWYGVWVPAGTPADVMDKLASDVARALAAPDLRAQFTKIRVDPISMDRAEFARFVRSEIEDFARIIKASGIKPEPLPIAVSKGGAACMEAAWYQ